MNQNNSNRTIELQNRLIELESEKDSIVQELLDLDWERVVSGLDSSVDFPGIGYDELISRRKEARESKDWALSDKIRNYLDSKYIFIFDTKDDEGKPFQEIHYLSEVYFNLDEVYHYAEVVDKEGNVTPAWSETKRQKVGRLHGVKEPKSDREYLEFRIKSDIQSEKRSEAWAYSISCAGALRTGSEYTSIKEIKEGKITINDVLYNVVEITDLYIKAVAVEGTEGARYFVRPDDDLQD